MSSRHGKVARTPVSPGDPRVLTRPQPTPPTPTAAPDGQRASATREELRELAQTLLDEPSYHQRWRHELALARILDWLETFPGEDWQDRWLLSGAEAAGRRWGPPELTPAVRNRLTLGLGMLIVLRAVRPSYAWLSASRLLGSMSPSAATTRPRCSPRSNVTPLGARARSTRTRPCTC